MHEYPPQLSDTISKYDFRACRGRHGSLECFECRDYHLQSASLVNEILLPFEGLQLYRYAPTVFRNAEFQTD